MKKFRFIVASVFVLAVFIVPHDSLAAKNTTISLYDLGVLQLAAHDLFHHDRDSDLSLEDGKLNLSTLFDHGEDQIIHGGEFRNRENIFIFTVAHRYGELYNQMQQYNFNESRAKRIILRMYHQELKRAYMNAFGEMMPRAQQGDVTATEDLALRTVHDLLPGTIMKDRQQMDILDPSLHGQTLSNRDMRQQSAELDGELDPVFLDMVVFIPPDVVIDVNLLERDSSFADEFSTDYSFEYFMEELEDGRYDRDDTVMLYIRGLFAKGMWYWD